MLASGADPNVKNFWGNQDAGGILRGRGRGAGILGINKGGEGIKRMAENLTWERVVSQQQQ